MSTYDFSFIPDPALRQRLAQKLQGKKEDDGVLSAQDVNDVVSELSAEEGEGAEPLKLNMGKILSAIESGLNKPKRLYGADGTSKVLNAQGFNEGNTFIGDIMYDQLLALGIIQEDEEGNIIGNAVDGPTIFNFEAANKLAGRPVSNWNDFYQALEEKGVSYYDELTEKFDDYTILKYFIGPMITKDGSDMLFALNTLQIEADFADYLAQGNKIETPEDLIKAFKAKGSINGKIDEDVSQGNTGDCWFLSGILALAKTEAGAKAIQQAIQPIVENGVVVAYDVEFKGAFGADGKPVKIRVTVDELNKFDTDYNYNDGYSNGDNDMLLLEMAVNKLYEKMRYGEVVMPTSKSSGLPGYKAYSPDFVSFIEGGDAMMAISLLTGLEPDFYSHTLDSEAIYDILQNAAENPDTVLSFGLYEGEHTAQTMFSGPFNFLLGEKEGHAFAITGVTVSYNVPNDPSSGVDYDSSTVTFVNPWDSTTEYTMSWAEFVKLEPCQMSSTSLTDNTEGTKEKPESETYTLNSIVYREAQLFMTGDLTKEQFVAVMKTHGIDVTSISKDGDDTVVVKYTAPNGYQFTVSCNAKAVNDGVYGQNGKAVSTYTSAAGNPNVVGVESDGYLYYAAEFSDEELQQWFVKAMIVSDGEQTELWYYTPNGNWPEGITTPAELRIYLDSGVTPGKADYSDLEPDLDFLNYITNQNSYISYNELLDDIALGLGQDKDKVTIELTAETDESYTINILYPTDDGVVEIPVTVKKNEESEAGLIKNGSIDSEFKQILDGVDYEDAGAVYALLNRANSGDVSALAELQQYGFEVGYIYYDTDNERFSATITLNNNSTTSYVKPTYTFNFDGKSAVDFYNNGFIDEKTLNEHLGRYSLKAFDGISTSIKDIASIYPREELRYVSNVREATAFTVDSNGNVHFDDEKAGKVYKEFLEKIKDLFHNAPGTTLDDTQIEQLLQQSWNRCRDIGDQDMESFLRHVYYDMHSALFKIAVSGELPEGVSLPSTREASEPDVSYSRGTEQPKFNVSEYIKSSDFGTYMGKLGNWCANHNYNIQMPVIEGDRCNIEITDRFGAKVCTIVISSDGTAQVVGSPADRPPLPIIKTPSAPPSGGASGTAAPREVSQGGGSEPPAFNLIAYMDSTEFGSYMGELGKWCSQQHNYHFLPPVIDGDECQIEIEDSMGITICTVIIDSEGNARVDYTGGFGSSADRPPLPDIKK